MIMPGTVTPRVGILPLMTLQIGEQLKGQRETFQSSLITVVSYSTEDTNKRMKSRWDMERTVRGEKERKKLHEKTSNSGEKVTNEEEKFVKKTN